MHAKMVLKNKIMKNKMMKKIKNRIKSHLLIISIFKQYFIQLIFFPFPFI